jgi:predicted dehydrogenase
MIGIGLIGCGSWGFNYLKTLVSIPEATILYVCDLQEQILNNVKLLYPHLRVTNRYQDLLEDCDVRGVIIATPPESHFSLAAKFLAGKKAVLVEKPVTYRYREAEELIRLARQSNTTLMAGHLMEYHPVVLKLQDCISKGLLGDLRYILLERANLGKVRHDVSVLWDLAVHDLSIVRRLVGRDPLWVSAQGGYFLQDGLCDMATITIGFEGKLLVNILVNWIYPVKKRQLAVAGNRMMAFWDDAGKDSKLLFVAYNQARAISEVVNKPPLICQCKHFFSCIEKNTEPQTGLQDISWVMKVLDLIEQSLFSNGARLYFRHDR